MIFRMTYRHAILLAVIVIFHTIGIVGLLGDGRENFLRLSPISLLLAMTCLVLSFFPRKIANLHWDVIVVGAAGFAVECIGVHTQWLFGDYAYGNNLGPKLWDVPLIIAVNWAMLSFAAIACVLHLRIPNWLKAVLSALLMTGLDLLIEPVAIESGFWRWKDNTVPFYNYACWFAIAFGLHWYLIQRKTPQQNPVSVGLFVVLLVFFGILNAV